ncbi:MAG: TIGR02206 family membrane protein [Aeromicrobium sp.]
MSPHPAPFHAYGPSHMAALAVTAIGIVAVLVFARWAPRRLDRAFAVAIVAIALPMQLVQFTPAEWSLQKSLPLQLCDWAWLVAAVALWTRSRLAATITYLWGLTLTTQGLITPALTTPFPGLRWWLFFAMHMLIVWSAVYVIWAMKLHPTWRTYAQTVAITIGWMVFTFAFNLVAGTNYGYLNGKPGTRSALDLLGPWPMYVIAEIVIVAGAWALLTWPWTRERVRTPLILS